MDHGASSKSVTSSLSRLPTGTFSQLLPGAQDHETVSANLLRTLNTPEDDEEIKRNLRAGAVSELHRERTMRNIKEVCGVKNSGVQSDFHSMREKGMFFCGYQDVSMKKQGLPSVFAVEGEIQDVVSSDDETELMDTSRRAIPSPEEDRKIMLHRVKGTTVMRRTPEKHEAPGGGVLQTSEITCLLSSFLLKVDFVWLSWDWLKKSLSHPIISS